MKDLAMIPRLPVDASVLLDKKNIKYMVEEKNALVFTFIDPKSPTRQVDFFMLEGLNYASLINHTQIMDSGDQKLTF